MPLSVTVVTGTVGDVMVEEGETVMTGAPVLMIGETTYGNLNVEKTREILDEYRAKEAQ